VSKIFECLICGEPDYTPTCPRCFSSLSFMLASIPEEYVLLTLSYAPPSTGGDGRSSKAVHAPLPLREDALNLSGPASRQDPADGADQVGPMPVLEVLASWVTVLNEERHLTAVRRNVVDLVDRLTKHLGWIVKQAWVGDFYREVQETMKAIRKITLTEPQMVLLKGIFCPTCGRLGMVRYYPDNYAARCRFCPSVRLDRADYDALVQGQARDAGDTG
jgi:hypothetical protein